MGGAVSGDRRRLPKRAACFSVKRSHKSKGSPRSHHNVSPLNQYAFTQSPCYGAAAEAFQDIHRPFLRAVSGVQADKAPVGVQVVEIPFVKGAGGACAGIGTAPGAAVCCAPNRSPAFIEGVDKKASLGLWKTSAWHLEEFSRNYVGHPVASIDSIYFLSLVHHFRL